MQIVCEAGYNGFFYPHPWHIELTRYEDRVTVVVKGERGGLKARLWINFTDLQKAVSELEREASQ